LGFTSEACAAAPENKHSHFDDWAFWQSLPTSIRFLKVVLYVFEGTVVLGGQALLPLKIRKCHANRRKSSKTKS